MKNKKFRTLLVAGATLFSISGLVSCNSTSQFTIGILQPVEHDALSAARQGFEDKLAEMGLDNKKVKINYQNANGNEADLNTLAKTLTSKCDLTLGIGTGASVALQSAQVNSGSEKPIVFTAVTDAVSAGLVESNEAPGGYITGSSDANPVEAQIDLIKECIPGADKIGILYTQSETNSEVQANQAKTEAEKEGMAVEVMTCTDSSDLSTVANALCSKEGIDAIYIPTDNNIAANMPTVKAALETYHVLCVTGEDNMMAQGGHVTLSISYYDLGKKAGEMAAKILNKEKSPSEIPVATMSLEECSYMMCSENLTAAGINLPEEVVAKCTNKEAK